MSEIQELLDNAAIIKMSNIGEAIKFLGRFSSSKTFYPWLLLKQIEYELDQDQAFNRNTPRSDARITLLDFLKENPTGFPSAWSMILRATAYTDDYAKIIPELAAYLKTDLDLQIWLRDTICECCLNTDTNTSSYLMDKALAQKILGKDDATSLCSLCKFLLDVRNARSLLKGAINFWVPTFGNKDILINCGEGLAVNFTYLNITNMPSDYMILLFFRSLSSIMCWAPLLNDDFREAIEGVSIDDKKRSVICHLPFILFK